MYSIVEYASPFPRMHDKSFTHSFCVSDKTIFVNLYSSRHFSCIHSISEPLYILIIMTTRSHSIPLIAPLFTLNARQYSYLVLACFVRDQIFGCCHSLVLLCYIFITIVLYFISIVLLLCTCIKLHFCDFVLRSAWIAPILATGKILYMVH